MSETTRRTHDFAVYWHWSHESEEYPHRTVMPGRDVPSACEALLEYLGEQYAQVSTETVVIIEASVESFG